MATKFVVILINFIFMSYSDIENKLNSGKIIILDGGMGA